MLRPVWSVIFFFLIFALLAGSISSCAPNKTDAEETAADVFANPTVCKLSLVDRYTAGLQKNPMYIIKTDDGTSREFRAGNVFIAYDAAVKDPPPVYFYTAVAKVKIVFRDINQANQYIGDIP